MSEPTPQAQIDAATAYEALRARAVRAMGPRVADAAQIERGQRVLIVACGTGVPREKPPRGQARPTSCRGGPHSGMLAVRLAPSVEWREELPSRCRSRSSFR
jgi:hypothetical protein